MNVKDRERNEERGRNEERERNEDYVRKIGFQFPPGFKTQYCLF